METDKEDEQIVTLSLRLYSCSPYHTHLNPNRHNIETDPILCRVSYKALRGFPRGALRLILSGLEKEKDKNLMPHTIAVSSFL